LSNTANTRLAAALADRRDFATDGSRFYFAIEDRQSDVFVAEMIAK